MKVKIFEEQNKDILETKLNKFIKGKKIIGIDLLYQTVGHNGIFTALYFAKVLYK